MRSSWNPFFDDFIFIHRQDQPAAGHLTVEVIEQRVERTASRAQVGIVDFGGRLPASSPASCPAVDDLSKIKQQLAGMIHPAGILHIQVDHDRVGARDAAKVAQDGRLAHAAVTEEDQGWGLRPARPAIPDMLRMFSRPMNMGPVTGSPE